MFEQPLKKKEEVDAIIVENVRKRFRIPHEKRNTILENIAGIAKGRNQDYDEFCALQNISFKVKKGEKLGIVGENGSGKSTLLKMISGVLVPDSGNIKVFGKVAPFLELGVGFQPELTAEENVRLYGAIMGMSKKEIEEKFDYIFEFAELERFKQMKLKNFSSGMYMRLAFATATATDPDILLIDEVLAVGDEAFQRKCFDKINEFKMNGKTIVLVTHNLETVKQLCDSAMLLEHGQMVSMGNSEMVIDDYHKKMRKKEEAILKTLQVKIVQQESSAIAVEEISTPEKVEPPKDRWGSREVEITEVKIFAENGEERYIFETGEPMIVRMKYSAKQRIEEPVFGIAIHRIDGVHINGPNTKTSGYEIKFIEGEGEIYYSIITLPLLDGTYQLSAAVYDDTRTHAYDHHDRKYKFKVIRGKIGDDLGIIYIPCKWDLRD
jgi:ABC-type polysaccharide/polyol phosphate transport system ATPase subunit